MVTIKFIVMKSKIYLLAMLTLFLIPYGCNKEDPMPVSASFKTNIVNSTLTTKQGFTVYTSEAKGEFLTYFKGSREDNSYGTGNGTVMEAGTDSLVISSYGIEGTYTFTLVSTSYGNWGTTVAQDVQSIDITVVAQ